MTSAASIYRTFGDQAHFAIVCAHDPFGGTARHVYGRMCIRAGDGVLGDFDEPSCMLNVTASHLQAILKRLPQLEPDLFRDQSDALVWEIIDKALYADDDRSTEEIVANSERYSRYDFLTNGGESFDNSKSFIVRDGDRVKLLFKRDDEALKSMSVDHGIFCAAIRGFLDWIDAGGM